MISGYNGNKIEVITYCYVGEKTGEKITEHGFHGFTSVQFSNFDEKVIEAYCNSNFPWGKAGAIGI